MPTSLVMRAVDRALADMTRREPIGAVDALWLAIIRMGLTFGVIGLLVGLGQVAGARLEWLLRGR